MEKWKKILLRSLSDTDIIAEKFDLPADESRKVNSVFPCRIPHVWLKKFTSPEDPLFRQCVPDPAETVKAAVKPADSKPLEVPKKEKPKKLTFKEQTEFNNLEEEMPQLEERIAEIEAMFQDADFFSKYGSQTNELNTELENLKKRLDEAAERWLELAERA